MISDEFKNGLHAVTVREIQRLQDRDSVHYDGRIARCGDPPEFLWKRWLTAKQSGGEAASASPRCAVPKREYQDLDGESSEQPLRKKGGKGRGSRKSALQSVPIFNNSDNRASSKSQFE